jgi:hypothetical protein
MLQSFIYQRGFSANMAVPAQREIMDEISRRQQNIDLGDLVLDKSYKEEYLSYIKGGNVSNSSSHKGYQSMLTDTQNEEEALKFDNML